MFEQCTGFHIFAYHKFTAGAVILRDVIVFNLSVFKYYAADQSFAAADDLSLFNSASFYCECKISR